MSDDDTLTILLYASNPLTREDVRLALGRKIARDLPPVSVVEVATQPAVVSAMDEGGIDLAILDGEAVPGRIGYPFRLLVMFLMLPFHAILGISIMSAGTLIAEDWYLAFERSWPPSPLDDQYLAGAIMWGSGDLVALLMLAALFVQWFRHSQREAKREDRRLDRLDAAS